MLHSEFVKELLGWTMPSRKHVFVAALDARDGFLEVPQFAVEEGGQGLVQRFGGVLATLAGELF
jgi:hypothetical protein